MRLTSCVQCGYNFARNLLISTINNIIKASENLEQSLHSVARLNTNS